MNTKFKMKVLQFMNTELERTINHTHIPFLMHFSHASDFLGGVPSSNIGYPASTSDKCPTDPQP
jgi:hypothetical protein